MIIYVDESGSVGFNANNPDTSLYFVMAALVCDNIETAKMIDKSVKRTLKNKLPAGTTELKGSKLELKITEYFLNQIRENEKWRLYAAIADKKTWAKHHFSKSKKKINQHEFYDEVARRLFSQIDISQRENTVNAIIDLSKSKRGIKLFDAQIQKELHGKLNGRPLFIRHRSSDAVKGLQAVDVFCWGIRRKYQYGDFSWYGRFNNRIAVEVLYKF